MNESLEIEMCGLPDFAHLLEGSFPGQYYTLETCLFQELYTVYRGVMALSAGMQLDGREVALQQTHILNKQCVNTNVVELMNHPHGSLDFVVE